MLFSELKGPLQSRHLGAVRKAESIDRRWIQVDIVDDVDVQMFRCEMVGGVEVCP